MKTLSIITAKLVKRIFILSLIISPLACDSGDGENNEGCGNAVCTAIYISLNVNVVDSTNEPVALDSYTVTDTQNNRNLPPDLSADTFENMQANGRYVFFSDFWLEDYRNESTVLRFTGFLNGTEVVATELEVNADCCHVSLVSGEVDLVVAQ